MMFEWEILKMFQFAIYMCAVIRDRAPRTTTSKGSLSEWHTPFFSPYFRGPMHMSSSSSTVPPAPY